jgi:hypothetical protein
MEQIKDDQKVYHGLDALNIDYISVLTQSHIGIYPPQLGDTDVRHNNLDTNRQRFPSAHYQGSNFDSFLFQSAIPPQQQTPFSSHGRHHSIAQARKQWKTGHRNWKQTPEKLWYHTPCGVKHLDRLWYETGKKGSKTSIPSRSSDLVSKSGYATTSALRFMSEVNLYAQEILLPRVLATFPTDYEHKYRQAFRVAALNQEEETRPAFHTGHVIVHNQPVHQHMDAGDSGFCVTFCTGSFEGGYVAFPDLGLVFLYRPGDVLMFRSKALYHGVMTWIPKGDINPLGVMPGRTAHVLYTKESALNYTKKKRSGYAWRTNLGKEPAPKKRKWLQHEFTVEHDLLFKRLRNKALYHVKEKAQGTKVFLSDSMKRYLRG